MKDTIKITASLTGVCVAAALILGAVFAKTDHARKENEEKMKEETIQSLLHFGEDAKGTAELKIYGVHRYVVRDDKGSASLAYVVPVKDKGYVLVGVELSGKAGKVIPVQGDAVVMAEEATRNRAVEGALPKGSKATYADTVYVANIGDKRQGYVVPGVTQGFKTFVKFMVSMDSALTLMGVAITESEEDPSLGDEIKKDYFKNQFVGKTLDILKELKVIKEPLPGDYIPALEPAKAKKAGLSPDQIREIKAKHAKDDIYALTGATISSNAVTNGVKNTVKKFVYRLGILNEAIKQENVQVAF
jgi:Na+-translocating ferredoxin:NAD+ oxidoreductase subunit G